MASTTATAEQLNKAVEAELPKDGGMDVWTMKEAIQDRRWFMQNGKDTHIILSYESGLTITPRAQLLSSDME